MQKFYATFGSGSPLANYYVVIEAEDDEAARLQMHCWFTQHWGSCYDADGWMTKDPNTGDPVTQADRYGLIQLHVPRSASVRMMTNPDGVRPEIADIVYHSGRVAMHAR